MRTRFICNYPLEHQHDGTMLGNGYIGLEVWGEGRELRISVGCAGLWDHRGGLKWTSHQNYKDVRDALEANDAERLKTILTDGAAIDPKQSLPSKLIPVGRIVLTLKDGCTLLRNELDRSTGGMKIFYSDGVSEKYAELRLQMLEEKKPESAFALKCDDFVNYSAKSSFELSSVPGRVDAYGNHIASLEEVGFAPPIKLSRNNLDGFVQPMPADDAFGLAIMADNGLYTAAFKRGANLEWLKVELQGGDADEFNGVNAFQAEALSLMLPGLSSLDWDALVSSNAEYWGKIWADIPEISSGNDNLDEIYYDGIFKFASMTDPEGVPAGLQGPWLEDDMLPPWSGDYHLNINVEMCYWPAFRAGLWKNLRNLFDMIWKWRDMLRDNARSFVGIEDGYTIPMAVDDRGIVIGCKSWGISIFDHACSAWIAQLMYDYVDYSSDMDFLKDVALPFMRGAMNVYLKMMEQGADGSLRLPVGISPEYRDFGMNAWGANASFQLAAAHRLAQNLVSAANMLQLPLEQSWLDVIEKLPLASIKDNEIALWDGLLLEESHRHHSHLAGICPFDVFDLNDPKWKNIVDGSIERWNSLGMGRWSGWCIPWAAMIENHLDYPDSSELLLDIWRRQFNNKGGGSMHDARVLGIFWMHYRTQLMQMDGAMGATTAVQDMMLHSRLGVIHLFAGCSACHEKVSFANMPAPGGFRFSASRNGNSALVEVTAGRDNTLKLVCHCTAKTVEIQRDGTTETMSASGVLELMFKKGEKVVLSYK